MTPVTYAAVWAGSGLLAAALLSMLRHRRLAWIAPAVAGLLALAVRVSDHWPGPTATGGFGASLTLGHAGIGLLAGAGVALAATMLLAPRLDGGEVVAAGFVGAAATVVLAATVPVIWSVAVAAGVAALAVRWIAAAPGRPALAAGRVAGLGAAALLAAAAFLPGAGPAIDTRTALAGGLLAGGVAAELGLVPLGGWAASAVSAVRAADLAPWLLLLAPAVLFTTGILLPSLPSGSKTPLANVLLGLGLATALFSGAQALRDRQAAYGRVVIADLALAAAALGTLHSPSRVGGYLIVLTHLCAAPLLLNPARGRLERQRRLAWLALTSLPPLPGFWGRFLVLQAFFLGGNRESVPAYLAVALLTGVAVRALAGRGLPPPPDTPPAGRTQQVVGWLVVAALFGLGLAPSPISRAVFGLG